MSDTWLVLDVSNLAWRNFHATGALSYKGVATGVLFGIFRDLKTLQERFQTKKVAWCFDKGRPLRLDIYPAYKERRHKAQDEDEEKRIARDQVREQVAKLRDSYLKRLGYRNVFFAEGYEADDVMAEIARSIRRDTDKDCAVLVSSDKDLWQSVRGERVFCYNMTNKVLMSEKMLEADFRVTPQQWMKVKSLCGCGTDEIGGIKGVGEKTAIKYILDELPQNKSYMTIASSSDIVTRNLKLVKLPFENCPSFDLQDDDIIPGAWDELMDELGIKSLAPPDETTKWRMKPKKGLLDGA